MATTGKVNSTLVAIYVGGTKIAHMTGASLNVDHSVRDVTTKDSAGWQENLEGLRSWGMSGSGQLAFDAAYGTDDLVPIVSGRTTATLRITTGDTGDTYYEGTAYGTNVNIDSPGAEETVTWSGEWTGTGALTIGTES